MLEHIFESFIGGNRNETWCNERKEKDVLPRPLLFPSQKIGLNSSYLLDNFPLLWINHPTVQKRNILILSYRRGLINRKQQALHSWRYSGVFTSRIGYLNSSKKRTQNDLEQNINIWTEYTYSYSGNHMLSPNPTNTTIL